MLAVSFLAMYLHYHRAGHYSALIPYLLIILPPVATIGSGIFAAIMEITYEEGHAWISPKKIFWKTVSFFFIQIVISPFIGFGLLLFLGLAGSFITP